VDYQINRSGFRSLRKGAEVQNKFISFEIETTPITHLHSI
jgi:hypothetical protein